MFWFINLSISKISRVLKSESAIIKSFIVFNSVNFRGLKLSIRGKVDMLVDSSSTYYFLYRVWYPKSKKS